MKSIYKTFFKKVLIVCAFCFAFILTSNAEKLEDLNVNKYVNDYANIIEDNTELELENKLQIFFASTTHQIVIVTVNNMDGDYIEHYSIKLAEKIKAGSEKSDNGVMFLVAKEDRKLRIEVGYGLEGALTDIEANRIIKEYVTPEFKNEKYAQGIKQGTEQIVKQVEGENFPKEEVSTNSFLKILSKMPPEIFLFIFFFGFGIVQWIVSILGRTKSWWLGGVIGLVISILLFLFLVKSLFVFLIMFFGFVFDYFVSKNYKEHKTGDKDGPADWWAGGNWGPGSGGWGGSSRSSGGFSGGGGSFGGGGSSGSW